MAAFNFFEKKTVSGATFVSVVNIDPPWPLTAFSLVNEGSVVIEYSFDGVNVHGDMTPSTSTAAMFFDNRSCSRIWFRAASGTSVVRVEAWTSN